MPKVQIKETYKSGSINYERDNFTVYIPVQKVSTANESEPALYRTYNDLLLDNYTNLNFKAPIKYDDQDLNYLIARKLLEKGLPVLLEGIDFIKVGTIYDFTATWLPTSGLYAGTVELIAKDIEGGDTKTYNQITVLTDDNPEFIGQSFYVSTDAKIGSTQVKLYSEISAETPVEVPDILVSIDGYNKESLPIDFEKLQDKALYNIRFLTLGNYIDKNLSLAMMECAANRKDSIALVDHIEDLSNIIANPSYESVSEQVGKVRTYFEQLVGHYENEIDPVTQVVNYVFVPDISNDILKAVSANTPWIDVTLNSIVREQGTSDIIVKDKEVKVIVPASFGYLSSFASAIKQNPQWYAIAGSFRGNIEELNDVTYNYTSADVEVLQGRSRVKEVELDGAGDNIGLAINPINKIIPFGYLINGNRTLYVESYEDINRPSYKGILSIRNLVCAIAKQLYYASKKYTFEPNTDVTYVNFESEITPLLDKMKSGLGIRGYKFTRLATTAKGRISAKISIKPIEPVEDFDLTIELDDSIDIVE